MDDRMDDKLEPCPFCGCTRISVEEDTIARHAYAHCSQCCSTGPDMADRRVAIMAWNGRNDDGHKKVLTMIQSEREKQIARHSYSKEHDKIWADGELAQAAAVYAMPAQKRRVEDWPFDMKFYRPESRIDELIKAAALIVAEIERISQDG